MVVTERFSTAVFSSMVMNATLARYHLSALSSRNISEILVRFTALTEKSPDMKGVCSSMMRASASVNDRASTR